MSDLDRLLALLGAGFAGTVLAGCAASGTPQYDGQFGLATRAVLAQQVHDASAPQKHAGQMTRADGRTMREAQDRHLGSFKEPPTSSVISIGVGGGGTR